jgi:hypothetical protein
MSAGARAHLSLGNEVIKIQELCMLGGKLEVTKESQVRDPNPSYI